MIANKIRSYLMVIAIIFGIVFSNIVFHLSFILPYAISLMLFFTYITIDFKKLRLTRLHITLIFVQLFLVFVSFTLAGLFDLVLAQSMLVLTLMPVASASAIITNMLGGNLEEMTAYNIFNNIIIALVTPFFFAFANSEFNSSILSSSWIITKHVAPVLFLPLLVALFFYLFFKKARKKLQDYKPISFYLWVLSLTIAIGKTYQNLSIENVSFDRVLSLAIISLLICITLFAIGKYIGSKFGQKIVGGQALGQKNTLLGIWMSYSFFSNPIISIAPGFYIIWQNLINSYQLWKKGKE